MNVAEEFNLDPTLFAMNGGEDYELLFTISKDNVEKIKTIEGISIIGEITEEKHGVRLYGRAGGSTTITAQGWNAYDKDSEK